ncbi:MAG: hypothetical protein UY50_C0017G0007 [Parcubacteria group bacterium GW2011_GWA2_49_9]|nr:MAG: hypothetical protein UY50_C0017G0007 [Parcubacteria group bacterium GW2011_GWA2_49_9]
MKKSVLEKIKRRLKAKLGTADQHLVIHDIRLKHKGHVTEGRVLRTSHGDFILKSPTTSDVLTLIEPERTMCAVLRSNRVSTSNAFVRSLGGFVVQPDGRLIDMPHLKEGAVSLTLMSYKSGSVSLAELIRKKGRRKHLDPQLEGYIRDAAHYSARKHSGPLTAQNSTFTARLQEPATLLRIRCRYVRAVRRKIDADIILENGPPAYLTEEELHEANALCLTRSLELLKRTGEECPIDGDLTPWNLLFPPEYWLQNERNNNDTVFVVDTGSVQMGGPALDVGRLIAYFIGAFFASDGRLLYRELAETYLRYYTEERANPNILESMPLPYWRVVLFTLNERKGLLGFKTTEQIRAFAQHGLEVLRRGAFFMP